MLSTVIASASIVVISLLFGIGLLVAWWQFDLQRHVAYWALSFMASALGHGLRIAGGIWVAEQSLFAILACYASVASFALLAWGFRYRAGRGARWVMVCWVASFAVLMAAWLAHGIDWRMISRIVTAVGDAALVAIIVVTLRPARGPGLIVQWTMGAFGLYVASVGVAAWFARPGGEIPDAAFIAVLSVGTPTGMIGTGILTLLIVSADLAKKLRKQATTDALTGLLNRRGLDEDAAGLLGPRRRSNPVVLVVADLDHFKSINDSFGHAAGDDVLCGFARHLRASTRPGDLVARSGGEEFVLLLPRTSVEEALVLVETLRQNPPVFSIAVSGLGPVTASFGVVLMQPGEPLVDALARADTALYQSKRDGRDRITVGHRDQSVTTTA
jgi:diguanylate cyclase (GGDEF)-like protein